MNKLPYIDDKNLYAAVMSAINSINEGYPKAYSIRNAAKWRNVKQTEVREYVEEYFPQSFFDARRKKVKSQSQTRRQQEQLDYQAIKHMRSM